MIRRRIFAYAVAQIAGIVAGYYIVDRSEWFFGTAFLIAIGWIISVIPLECNEKIERSERYIMLAFLLCAFMSFVFTYIEFNGRMTNEAGEILHYDDVTRVSGRVERIQAKDDGYKIIIKCNNIKGLKKVQASYYQDLPLTENSDIVDDNKLSVNTNVADIYSLLGRDVTMYGTLKLAQDGENPACFNYKLYLNSIGIRYTMSGKYLKIDSENNSLYWRYKRSLYTVRDQFVSLFGEEQQAFIKGVVLGDKSNLSEDVVDDFSANQTGHVLAVSGLHIGFLYSLLKTLTKKKRSKAIAVLIITVMFLYGEMTMWSSATTRAFIVAAVKIVSIYVRRPFDLLSSISTASIILLTLNPLQLFNSGFQLSFMALMGICFLTKPYSHFMDESFAVLMAVQTTVSPLIMYSYNSFNAMSIFINVPIVYMASILVPMTIIALMIMLIFNTVPNILIILIEALSDFIVELNTRLTFDNFFYNNIPGINASTLFLFYLLLFLAFSEWTRVKLLRQHYDAINRKLPLIIAPVLILCIMTANTFANDEVVFVSVGQGDCIHIKAKANNVLIDGGGNANYNIGKNVLRPYLLKSGTDNLDMAIVTHLHMDHYQGILELNEIFPIAGIGVPADSVGTAELPEHALAVKVGNRVNIAEGVYVEPIWPIETSKSGNQNENNTVYMIYYGNYKILVTGDMLEADELEMVRYYEETDILRADVLKVGHHGSKSSSSEDFLDAVSPQIAVISVGLDNMYGHPHQQTLDRLAERGIEVYRTDVNGAVGLDIRKKSIHIDTMH